MNLLDASVARPDGVTVIDAGPIKLASNDRLTARLRDLPDRRVILGIRPEHIHDPDYLPPGIDPLRINVTVDVVESLGSETYLHLTSGDTSFIARVDPRSAATPGEPFQVAIDQDRLYAFNAETGLAI
jgi:multiple sugar transport system ATP-binding protein